MTKKERRDLISVLNVGMFMYVPERENRERLARMIGQRLELEFIEHFVEACVAEHVGDVK